MGTKGDQQMSWLEFILETIQNKDKKALSFIQDLKDCRTAIRYRNLGELKQSADAVKTSYKQIAVAMRTYKSPKPDPGCTDSFKRYFGSFAEKAEPAIEKLINDYMNMK